MKYLKYNYRKLLKVKWIDNVNGEGSEEDWEKSQVYREASPREETDL